MIKKANKIITNIILTDPMKMSITRDADIHLLVFVFFFGKNGGFCFYPSSRTFAGTISLKDRLEPDFR